MEKYMSEFVPPRPPKSFRVTLDIMVSKSRLDAILLNSLRQQKENLNLQTISRLKFKELFNEGKIQIKGQRARPSSTLNRGITYIDILGFTGSTGPADLS
jgi:hypothetical protein